MNPKHIICRRLFDNISKFNRKIATLRKNYHYYSKSSPACPSNYSKSHINFQPKSHFSRFVHTFQENALRSDDSEDGSEDDAAMNEFLSRFVWIMRGKLSEAYPDSDKKTIDDMLLIIVQKVVSEMEKGGLEQMIGAAAATPSEDFSTDLWRTVWEVSNVVLEDMEKEQKKEKMKVFLQSEEVKEMCRFAGEIGIRGDMLRELRFKWAREKMEESEFYQGLERLQKEEAEASVQEEIETKTRTVGEEESVVGDGNVDEEKPKVVTLPKRHGKLKYNIYGLDLSDSKWAEVAYKIHETEEIISPQEPKSLSGKCKLVTDKILSLQEEDDPSPLLAEWTELLQPSRVDWIALLDKLKEQNAGLHLKIAELVLDEESFQTNIHDYSRLIDAYARENRLEDTEKILRKMNENGILPDVLTLNIIVHMYSKAGKLDRAKEAFDHLRSQKFQPDMDVYNSMIMAYVHAGQPNFGASLMIEMREMEARDIKPTREIYMALLRSFAEQGDGDGAERIITTMQLAGTEPDLEARTLLVEAYAHADQPDQARLNFDYMIKLGHKPDDKCTANMIAAYEKHNLLHKALDLLLQLEKDGFEPGVATYTVLVDWLAKLQLVDEAEQLLNKIAHLSEAPSFDIHISLCEMYSRAGIEKKALQALGVVEAKSDQLGQEGFERVIEALKDGGFVRDAQRMHELMKTQGFTASEEIEVSLKYSASKKTIR